jgi:hypothetical protein
MDIKRAQLHGYELTEKEIEALTREALYEIEQAYEDISQRLEKLYAQYSSASGSQELYEWVTSYNRYKALQSDLSDILRKRYKNVERNATEAVKLGMANNYYRQAFMFQFAEVPLRLSALNEDLIDFALAGQTDTWKRISRSAREKYGSLDLWEPQAGSLSRLIKDNRDDELKQIRRAINSGLITGDSYASVREKVADIMGISAYKQGDKGAKAAIERIVRTEGNRALNAGNYANAREAASQGISIERTWDASLDSRTRPEHARMDGKSAGIDEPFVFPQGWTAMFPGTVRTGSYRNDARMNINCRCTVAESANGFKPSLRRGKNPVTGKYEVFTYKTFDQWAAEKGLKRNKYGRLYKDE